VNDITVNDGSRTKIYTPMDRYAVYSDTDSLIWPWTETPDTLAVVSQVFGATTLGAINKVTPGQVATLWGGSDKLCADWPPALQQFKLPLPTEYIGCSVHLLDDSANDILASLYFISGNQVNVQFPSPLANGDYRLQTRSASSATNIMTSNTLVIKVVGLNANFVQYQGKLPYLAVLHNDDYSLVTAANPARPKEFVQIYATGLGPTSPTVPAGQAMMAPLITYPTITISGVPAWVQWAGLHSVYPGLYQINVQVPANVASAVAFDITSFGPDGSKQTDNFQVEK
jgi:uncharacterized protein (TIGR03437 family)